LTSDIFIVKIFFHGNILLGRLSLDNPAGRAANVLGEVFQVVASPVGGLFAAVVADQQEGSWLIAAASWALGSRRACAARREQGVVGV
jgi:hypothetical protein